MQIVIDLPEEDYKGICHLTNEQLRMLPVEVAETLIRIANGTPVVTGTATWNYDNETCKYCGNNPKNGGSGVCHCTLAAYKIT